MAELKSGQPDERQTAALLAAVDALPRGLFRQALITVMLQCCGNTQICDFFRRQED